jgi:hypothetical protein
MLMLAFVSIIGAIVGYSVGSVLRADVYRNAARKGFNDGYHQGRFDMFCDLHDAYPGALPADAQRIIDGALEEEEEEEPLAKILPFPPRRNRV